MMLDREVADMADSTELSLLCSAEDPSDLPTVELTGLLIDAEWTALARVGLDDLIALNTRGTCSDLDAIAMHTGRADARALGKVC